MKPSRRFDGITFELPPTFDQNLFIEELIKITGGQGFRSEYLHSEMLSKYLDESKVPAIKRAHAAVKKFFAAEERNSRTNQRLLFADDHDFGWVSGETLLGTVRKYVATIFGNIDDFDITRYRVVTNGASTRVRRSPTAAQEKLSGEMHVTSSAKPVYNVAYGDTILSDLDTTEVPGSVLFTVPKKSDIDRVACKEPEVNMLLQRSVGEYLRRRLRRFGIDLTDQSHNRNLARRAFSSGLATIDLSSASDLISRGLVISTLPPEWWSLLDSLRSHLITVPAHLNDDGNVRTHTLEMFSSMGNGFTFELETILFWCITRAVCFHSGVKGTISVYGDDIIAPSRIVPRLIRVFHYLGFLVNVKKTNYRGPFRESCGGHYWRGFDVTPFYIRGDLLTLPDLILVMNQATSWLSSFGCLASFEELDWWYRWTSYIPRKYWGGQNHLSGDSLVSGDIPRMRIVAKTKPIYATPDGAYRLFLVRRQQRTSFIGNAFADQSETSVSHRVIGLKQARNLTWERTHLNPQLIGVSRVQ